MRRFDAIVCDIDGCLGPESTAPLDVDALSRIAQHNTRAIERGDRAILTLCSGRPQPFAEAMCRFLANSAIPCVAENGVWLFDPRHNRFLMDPAITLDHVARIRAASDWIEQDLLPRGVIIQPGKSASISLWHPDTAFLKGEVFPRVQEEITRRGWGLRASTSIAWINLDLEHVSKGTGVRRLMAETGLTRERLAGIGDSMGDLAIRDNVAFFACPSNAPKEIQAHADYVSPKPEVHGVLDIIEKLH